MVWLREANDCQVAGYAMLYNAIGAMELLLTLRTTVTTNTLSSTFLSLWPRNPKLLLGSLTQS